MKKICILILSLLIAVTAALPASATDSFFVFDEADYLTDESVETIDSLLAEFNSNTGYSIYFLSIYRPNETINTDEYTKNFIDVNSLDNGGKSGLVCVLDLNNETHAIYDFGNDVKHFFSSDFVTAFNYSLISAYAEDNYESAFADAVSNAFNYIENGSYSFMYSQNTATNTFTKVNIADDADLLSDEQETELNKIIKKIDFYHAVDVVLHTTNSIGNTDIAEYADDYYDYNGYSYDGMLFMIDMGSRSYYTSTTGYAMFAFTDDKLEELHSVVTPYLSDGQYYEAFSIYLENVYEYLEAIDQNTESSYSFNDTQKNSASDIIKREIIVIGVSLIVAFVTVAVLKKQMNTAVKKTQANDYLVPGSLNITAGNDYFLTSSVVRVPKQQSTSSGGGSHRSSSGRSHGGGGGRF